MIARGVQPEAVAASAPASAPGEGAQVSSTGLAAGPRLADDTYGGGGGGGQSQQVVAKRRLTADRPTRQRQAASRDPLTVRQSNNKNLAQRLPAGDRSPSRRDTTPRAAPTARAKHEMTIANDIHPASPNSENKAPTLPLTTATTTTTTTTTSTTNPTTNLNSDHDNVNARAGNENNNNYNSHDNNNDNITIDENKAAEILVEKCDNVPSKGLQMADGDVGQVLIACNTNNLDDADTCSDGMDGRKTMDFQDEDEDGERERDEDAIETRCNDSDCMSSVSMRRSSDSLESTNADSAVSSDERPMVLGGLPTGLAESLSPPPPPSSSSSYAKPSSPGGASSVASSASEKPAVKRCCQQTKQPASVPEMRVNSEPITDCYDLETRPFARGKFALVKRAVQKSTGLCFAAKCIKKLRRSLDVTHEIMLEIEALKLSYQTDRIVKLHEVYETPTEMILILEMAHGGELQHLLDDEETIEEPIVKRMVKQILEGLTLLHANNIAHLDVKPQNILVTSISPIGDVKLCDFGISRRITKDCEIREICGTPDYVAPEILHYDPISLATDMWSLGILTYVLLTGYSPFGGENKQQTFCNITQAKLDFPSEIFSKISNEAVDFMGKLIVREPGKRLTSAQAKLHPWLI